MDLGEEEAGPESPFFIAFTSDRTGYSCLPCTSQATQPEDTTTFSVINPIVNVPQDLDAGAFEAVKRFLAVNERVEPCISRAW